MTNELVFCSPAVPHVALLDRLAPVAAAGFGAISLMPTDVWALEEKGMAASEIAARITDAGLRIAEMDCTSCWMPCHATQGDGGELSLLLRSFNAERVVETAARVGARSVVAVDLSDASFSQDQAASSFAALCDLAARHGLKAHIEFLPVGGIKSLGEAWTIVQAAGRANGGLTIDAWHFFRSGSCLADLAAIPGERIHTLQLCDAPAVPAQDLWSELMTSRLLPGEGELDLDGLLRTLRQISSEAAPGVEVFNERQNTMPLAQIASEWSAAARRVLAEAGANA
jgi:sugar phosphate isomerase/epimerase